MVTVSEQYKLEQENKRLKEEKSKLLRYFVCEKIDEVIEMAGDWSHNNGILREKLEKIKESIKQVCDDPKGHPVNAWFIHRLKEILEDKA